MLRVRLLARVMRRGKEHEPGEVLEVGDAEGESLCDRGLAELDLVEPTAAPPAAEAPTFIEELPVVDEATELVIAPRKRRRR